MKQGGIRRRHSLLQRAANVFGIGALKLIINDPLLLVPYFTSARRACIILYLCVYIYYIVLCIYSISYIRYVSYYNTWCGLNFQKTWYYIKYKVTVFIVSTTTQRKPLLLDLFCSFIMYIHNFCLFFFAFTKK